jgi:hypothetical protein
VKCPHPECTGVHDNNRFSELCPEALHRKRAKDDRYYASTKGLLNRARKTQIDPRAYAELEHWVYSGRVDELAAEALASGNPLESILRTTFDEVFAVPLPQNLTHSEREERE